MRKWPYLMLLLGACSQGDDHPPMIGDCSMCAQPPVATGGGGGGENDVNAGDATTGSDANDNGETGTGNFDALTNVDVGVANLDAPFPF